MRNQPSRGVGVTGGTFDHTDSHEVPQASPAGVPSGTTGLGSGSAGVAGAGVLTTGAGATAGGAASWAGARLAPAAQMPAASPTAAQHFRLSLIPYMARHRFLAERVLG